MGACFFLALVLLFLFSSGCITTLTLPSALKLLRKGPKFLYFFVTIAAFLTVLLRVTCPKARVKHLHSSHSLAVGRAYVTWPQSKTSSCVKLGELAGTR